MIEKDEDGVYVPSVPALKGCHTQAKSNPFHKGEDLGRGLIRKILKDIEISVEE